MKESLSNYFSYLETVLGVDQVLVGANEISLSKPGAQIPEKPADAVVSEFAFLTPLLSESQRELFSKIHRALGVAGQVFEYEGGGSKAQLTMGALAKIAHAKTVIVFDESFALNSMVPGAKVGVELLVNGVPWVITYRIQDIASDPGIKRKAWEQIKVYQRSDGISK